jgi:hypothetical protein
MNPMEAPKGKVREDKALCIVLLLCAHALDACAQCVVSSPDYSPSAVEEGR